MSFPRYPAYKDSGVEWLGEVPGHWSILPLKVLVAMRSGDAITSEQIEDEGEFPVFGGNGLRGYTANFTHEGSYALIGRQGALCGNVNYASGRFWASEHAVVCTPRRPIVTSWFGELLRAMNLGQYSIAAAQPGLSVDLVGRIRAPLPPPAEQVAIAAFLDRETARIDALVAEQERLIELLREKRQAVISHAVTKGLDPDVPMKPSGLDWLEEIPAHWGVARLDHLFNQARFPVSVEPDAAYQELGVRSHGRGVFHKEPLRGVDLDEKEVYWVQPGALMFNIVFAWEGAVAVTGAGEAGLVASHRFPMFMPEPQRAVPEFYKHFLTTNPGIRLLDWHSPGAAGRNRTLNRTHLVKELVPAPPVAEQRAICDALASEFARADNVITSATHAITLLQERRAALITAAVTGQIDVRGVA